MDPVQWIRLAGLAAMLAIAFAGGSNLKQAEWDRAENLALKQQATLKAQAENERDLANDLLLEGQVALEDAERKSERLNDALQIAINTEHLVETVVLAGPDNCPILQCLIPDIGTYFRLFNCGISNTSCETLPVADQAPSAAVSGTNSFTLVDGVYGLNHRRDAI